MKKKFKCDFRQGFFDSFFEEINNHSKSLSENTRIAMSNINGASLQDLQKLYDSIELVTARLDKPDVITILIKHFVSDSSGANYHYYFGANTSHGQTIPLALLMDDASIIIKNPYR